MEKFVITRTSKTPFISLEKGLFQFSGSCIPADAKRFYKPVLDWIKNYRVNNEIKTIVNFNFDYLDSASSKNIVTVLKILDSFNSLGQTVVINWYYEEGDEDMLHLGIHLKSMSKASFNFIEKERSMDEVKVYLATV